MSDNPIYLSLVVTARNDDHGGSLLNRMQAFVNAWIGQCRRHGLAAELLVVDWNPPADRCSLVDALRWPENTAPCEVRFIQVPPEVHQRYRHAVDLPLYQMIAKNVGIRRARGRYILAANIDILFSDELVQFLAERRLQPGRMYRIDRHDVMSDVPVEGPVDEQLAYCKSHLIRINAREGTFSLSPEGERIPDAHDIVSPDSGIRFGSGWYGAESHSAGVVFRWVSNDAEVLLKAPGPALVFDVEPGPGVNFQPFLLEILDAAGSVVAQSWIRRRCTLELRLPPDVSRFSLRVAGGGMPAEADPRILNFKVHHCGWSSARVSTRRAAAAAQPATSNDLASQYALHSNDSGAPMEANGLLARISRSMQDLGQGSPEIGRTVTVPVGIQRAMHAYYAEGGLPGIARFCLERWHRRRSLVTAVPPGNDVFDAAAGILPGFGWYGLESFRGEIFRWARQDAELVVRRGPGGEARLAMHIEPGPEVGWKSFDLEIREGGETIAKARVGKLQRLEIPLLLPAGTHVLSMHVEGGGRPAGSDPRTLYFRLFWCGWSGAEPTATNQREGPAAADFPCGSGLLLGAGWRSAADKSSGAPYFVAAGSAAIVISTEEPVPRVLRLELAPAGEGSFPLEVRNTSGRLVAAGILHGRQICYLTLPMIPGRTQPFTLKLIDSALRIYRLGWADGTIDITDFAAGLRTGAGWSPVSCAGGELCRTVETEAELEITVPAGPCRYLCLDGEAIPSHPVACSILDASGAAVAELSIGARRVVHVEVPWQPGTRTRFRLVGPGVRCYRMMWSSIPGEADERQLHFRSEGVMAAPGEDIVPGGIALGAGWYSPECPGGEVFRWASSPAEVLFQQNAPPRSLTIEIEPGPSLDRDSSVVQVLDRSWRRIAEFPLSGRQEIQVDLVQQAGWPNLYRFVVEAGGLPVADDPRTLDFRVYRIETDSQITPQAPDARWSAIVRADRWPAQAAPRDRQKTQSPAAVHLHTNACGDFTLMAREHWFDLRGYPEFDMYSFHIDSILCYAAHHAGAREEVLKDPMRIYHIEHGAGWTPEGQATLFERLRAKGILWIEYRELVGWAAQMRRLNAPIIFNCDNWGLAEMELPAMDVAAGRRRSAIIRLS